MAAQAKAVAKRQRATADQAARTRSLLDGGFVSQNEAELLTASSESEARRARGPARNSIEDALDVNDCVLVAPFDGEVSLRPGRPWFVRPPGHRDARVVDRNTVRMTADAPESDFDSIPPGTGVTVHVVATTSTSLRRSPAARPSADPARGPPLRDRHRQLYRRIPVDTTGELHVPVGEPVAVWQFRSGRDDDDRKATFFTVEGGTAHARVLAELGEVGPGGLLRPVT